MAIVNLTTLQDVLGGTTPVDAIFTATIYRGDRQAIRIVDDEVVFPDPVRVKLVGGIPVEPLILDVLDPDCHYKIDVFVDGTSPYRANVVLPAGEGPFDISDLVVVNPTTNIPDPGTSLAQAFYDSIVALRSGMVVDANVVGDNLHIIHVDGSTSDAGNVRGPKGDQGDTGPQGADGFIGVDGLSAYEVAVDNGFVGTEEQWLAYLRQGPSGTLDVGVVTTGTPGTNVIVTNTGTDIAAVLDFTIPRGDKGETGDPGATQNIAYTHAQGAVSNLWVINHDLTFQPSVQVIDSAGSTIEGVVSYNSSTQLQVEFSAAVSGTAYLS